MKILALVIFLSGLANAADFRPYSMTNSSGDSRFVNITGDTMTGQLTLSGSTLTITGNAFSVGGSTLSINYGRMSMGRAATVANTFEVYNATPKIRSADSATSGTYYSEIGSNYFRIVGAGGYIDSSAASNSGVHFRTSNASALDTTAMVLKGNGYVGVGTTAPDSKLSISSSTTSTAFISFLGAMTKAEILAFDPVQAGASVYCTDCTAATMCISTGTAVSQFADIGDRTVACN